MRSTGCCTMLVRTLALSLMLAMGSTAHAQTSPYDDELSQELRGIGSPMLSPDGRMLAYARTTSTVATNSSLTEIVLVDVADRTELARFSGSVPQWNPAGTELAFIGARNGRSGLWVRTIADARERFVVSVPQTDAWLGSGTVKNVEWSPDGLQFAFVAADSAAPKPVSDVRAFSRIMYKTRTGFTDDRRTHTYIVSAQGGSPRPLTSGSFDEHSIAWSPDGTRISFVSDRSTDPDNTYSNDLWIADVRTGAVTRVTDTPAAEFRAQWSPDGRTLAFTAWTRPSNTKDSPAEDSHLFLRAVDGGAMRDISAPLDRRVSQFVWAPDGTAVYFLAGDRGATQLYSASTTTSAVTPIVTCACSLGQFSLDRSGKTAAFVRSTITEPPDVYTVALGSRDAPKALTRVNARVVLEALMTDATNFTIPSFDGTPVQVWVMPPAGAQPGQKYPTILSIHGGPHGMYGYAFSDRFQLLSTHGYGIVFINPRGSSGYGQRFSDGTINNWGGGDYRDLMIGLDSAIARNAWMDTTRLGVTGGSYGGFMTNWIITQTPRFKAAVSIASVSNLISFYGTSLYTDLIESEFSGMPWKNYDMLWRWSPLAHIEGVRTPTLFIHGEDDMDVPITQAEEMYVGLRKQGVPATLARYPNEGHGFRQPQHIRDSQRRADAWFDQYLKPAVPTP